MSAEPIGGPLAQFLAECTDLGPAQGHRVQVTVALKDPARPANLIQWAATHSLTVRWRRGDNYAYVEGAAEAFGHAFGVEVHDYRSPDGQVFYASRQQPEIPAPVRDDVTDLGRVLSYNSTHRA